MRLTNFIQKLQRLLKENGDLKIFVEDWSDGPDEDFYEPQPTVGYLRTRTSSRGGQYIAHKGAFDPPSGWKDSERIVYICPPI